MSKVGSNECDINILQSCRKLLELMILDNIIIVRKMSQATSCEPPTILSSLSRSSFEKTKFIYREHYFANPWSAATLLWSALLVNYLSWSWSTGKYIRKQKLSLCALHEQIFKIQRQFKKVAPATLSTRPKLSEAEMHQILLI